MNPHILIIEDEIKSIELLSDTLSSEGYQLSVAQNGKDGLTLLRKESIQLVILDLIMPIMDGWETLRQIREFSEVPIIMLTGRDSDEDQVRGLENGADDYIIKPARVHIVRARVKSVLRRDKPLTHPSEPVLSYDDGSLVIDQPRGQVSIGGRNAKLTPTEYRLLLLLITNEGQIVENQEALTSVWGAGYEDDTKLPSLYISRLRKKIEVDPKNPQYIKTRRGRGYFFEAESA